MDHQGDSGSDRRTGFGVDLDSRRRLILTAVLSCWLLPSGAQSVAQPISEPSILPGSITDRVWVVDPDTGRTEILSGQVEDLYGSLLRFRSHSGGSQVIPLADVVRLDFLKSSEFERGLQFREQGDYQTAEVLLEAALTQETKPWVWREIQAALARNSVRQGDRQDAVQRIARIFEQDSNTRHLGLLPLVWDARMPSQAKLAAEPQQLSHVSPVDRLAAASALLDQPQTQSAAIDVLKELKRHPSRHLSLLADSQLWRLKLLDPDQLRTADVNIWQRRVPDLPVDLRAGPQYLLGRAFLAQYQYDAASRAFLWLPLMSPQDPDLTQQSVNAAINSLKLAGRQQEANLLRAEFPGTAETP